MDVPTAHPIVDLVRDAIVGTTGGSLVGLYLYGSLATGDFEEHVSDIDLIAVLTDVPDASLVPRLREMHARLAEDHRAWDDRIEVDYVSTRGLVECRTRTTTIARISPGEPLHLVEAGRDFLLDWYPARRDGVALVGPPLDSLIPPIPEREYRDEVLAYLAGFRDRFDEDAGVGSQAYAILTMCRGFYSIDRPRTAVQEGGGAPGTSGLPAVGSVDRSRARLAGSSVGSWSSRTDRRPSRRRVRSSTRWPVVSSSRDVTRERRRPERLSPYHRRWRQGASRSHAGGQR